MKLVIHIDGGSRGNPGPAAAGVTIADAETQQPVHEAGYHLGRATNNVAEYMGLIRALEVVEAIKADREVNAIAVISDSQLMVRQINGQYKVKNEALKSLFADAKSRLSRIGPWQIGHVKRELNKRADELANQAMDAGRDIVTLSATGDPAPTATPTSSTPSKSSTAAATNTPQAASSSKLGGVPADSLWSAYLTKSPGKKCPARCPAKTNFHFGSQLPAGFCIYAAQAVFDENPTLWSVSGTTQSQTQCPKCDVTIEVERTKG